MKIPPSQLFIGALLFCVVLTLLCWAIYSFIRKHFNTRFEIFSQRLNAVTSQQEIDQAIIKERDRIAQILHDEVGNKLIALLYEFDRHFQQNSFGTNGSEMLWHLTKKLKESISDTRALVREFSDYELNSSGIVTELNRFCKSKDGFQGVAVNLAGRSDAKRFDYRKEKEVVAMVKELVYNSLKYSGCWHIDVALVWKKNSLTVEVSDDGYGLRDRDLRKNKHSGLSGMQERCQAIGATLAINKPDKGTRITLTIPL